MNIYSTSVTRAKGRGGLAPRIAFNAEWLREMGFVHGALAQFMPESCGCAIVLRDENIPKYSELAHATAENGGTLITMNTARDMPKIIVSGLFVELCGLKYGDVLLAKYEYGFIRMRKVFGENVKITTAHLVGKWLVESAFTPGAVFTLDAQPGLITCTLWENGLERRLEVVKYAREHRQKVCQVQKMSDKRKPDIVFIDLTPESLQKAGFMPGDGLLAAYKYGQIQLERLDFTALGF